MSNDLKVLIGKCEACEAKIFENDNYTTDDHLYFCEKCSKQAEVIESQNESEV